MKTKNLDCHTLVIGSGPGGSTTAALLAEAGRDVLMVEEGGHFGLDSAEPYSIQEMNQKYRNSGVTPAFGKATVTYIEGRCVGGGSEINAALCHFPMDQTLKQWRDVFQIDEFGPGVLDPFFDEIRKDLNVSTLPDGLDPASALIRRGAEALGWASEEVPRFWRHDGGHGGRGTRQSMTETMVPRALRAGARILADTRVRSLNFKGDQAVSALATSRAHDGSVVPLEIRFQNVVVCGGPIQTPCILRRSGLGGIIGHNLRMHPMIRVVARFDEEMNDPSWGVPVEQVVEFKPHLTLGCSQSALPHMIMWLAGDVPDREKRLAEWRKMAIFYVLVTGHGRGIVRSIPVLEEPFVYHPLTDQDLGILGEGLHRLGRLLFTAGATEIYNPIPGGPALRSEKDLHHIRTGLPRDRVSVSTIHLFGTCAMGEDTRRCVVDSHGRMHGMKNVWINDASILPDTTGVNPQVTLMAIARRNVRRMVES